MKSAELEHVDAVILATATPDHHVPGTAPVVAHQLGLCQVPAFDLGAGCSGFVYATTVAAGLIHAGTVGTVLVIGAEKMSAVIDPGDRSTAPIFGDGAGAVVLTAGHADEPGVLGPAAWGSDGEHADAIVIPAAGPGAPTYHCRPGESLRTHERKRGIPSRGAPHHSRDSRGSHRSRMGRPGH